MRLSVGFSKSVFALQFLYFKTIFADYVMIELEFAIYKVCFADFTGFDDDTQKPYIYSLSIAVDQEYCWMLITSCYTPISQPCQQLMKLLPHYVR